MSTLRRILLLLIIITFLPLNTATAAVNDSSAQKVVMFIIDNINYDDITKFGGDNFKYLLENGALGLMNTNSGSIYTDTNAYATMGAGSYAVSSSHGNCSGGYDDVIWGKAVNEVFMRNTGKKMQEHNIANVDIINLLKNNQKLNHPVKIGSLGSLLNKSGLKTAVIGNESRSTDEISVNASLITMDSDGVTDTGLVGNRLLVKDPMSPFGIRTDYSELYEAFLQAKGKADFIVVQSGDSYRLNKYSGLSDDMYLMAKQKIFSEADDFLGKLLSTMDENTLFMLVTPFPSYEDAVAGKRLTPVIAYGNTVSGNILTSSTTKRDGIITNTDIASQILDFFSTPKDPAMTGHKFIYKNLQDPLPYIHELNAITVFNYKARPTVVKIFIGFIVASLVLTIIFIMHLKKYLKYLKRLLIAVMITPTLFLILPLFAPWSWLRFSVSLLLLATISVALLSHFLKDNLSVFSVCLLGSAALLVLDTFMGNPLTKVSIFGYDPIGGARFYGIGNEYEGFILGSTIIGTSALMDKFRHHEKMTRLLSIVIYAAVFFTMAHPGLGANVGGAISAFVCFSASMVLLFKGKISFMDLVKIGIGLLILLLGLFVYDGMRPVGVQSHIGQTSAMIREGSVFTLFSIFHRKLLMNYKLIRYSRWTLVLIAIIAALGMLFSWPVGVLKQIFCRHKYLYFGFVAGIIGTAATFAFNDSGVVAAAISMIPIGISLVLLCIDEKSEMSSAGV